MKNGEGRSNATPVRDLFAEERTLSNDFEDAVYITSNIRAPLPKVKYCHIGIGP